MTKILGISGKKGSGKNTLSNWLHCLELVNLGIVSYAKLDNLGRIVVPSDVDGQIVDGILDLSQPIVQNFLDEVGVSQVIKQYSFADPLKQFCIKVLGLSWESCYGTDEQKNQPTHLNWEEMPGVITEFSANHLRVSNSTNVELMTNKARAINCIYHQSGPMSGREILQWFGSDICRQIFGKCWINATLNQIKEDNSALAIITDIRFPNEVEGVQEVDGLVVRLTRMITTEDMHMSETKLDNYQKFDYILDNSTMSIKEQNAAVTKLVVDEWKMMVLGDIKNT